jgi:hypothetical protein
MGPKLLHEVWQQNISMYAETSEQGIGNRSRDAIEIIEYPLRFFQIKPF